MNTSMADGASERLDAQIADALFGQPGMSKMDVTNRLRQLRGTGAPLLVDVGNPVSVSLAGREDAISALVADWEARPGITDAYRICAEELKAALAAHQPVGQEPVGYLFTDDPAVYAMPGSGFHAGSQPPQDAINVVPVYAAPPAQAVDLVRARDSIQALLNWIDDWAETPEESGLHPIAERALQVVAQIDAHVYASEPNAAPNRLTDTAQAVNLTVGDMFWLADDPERFGHSVDELIDDCEIGDEIEIQTAVRLPNFWVRVKVTDGCTDYDQIDSKAVGNG